MGQGYFNERKARTACCVRCVFPSEKLITYSVAAGMEQVADYLENLHFNEDDIGYLRSLGIFTEDYLRYLSELRFTAI